MAVLHYGWALAPPQHQADIWNITGALTRAALVVALAWRWRSRIALLAAAWWVVEELSVAGCSALFIVAPWPVLPGQAQCSALLHFDLAKIGAVVLACLVLALPVRSDSGKG